MQQRISSTILWIFLSGGIALAQENNSLNTYTPYSMYGLGDIAQQGLTSTGAMGGITCGVRDMRQIDYVNPAGATARDSVLNFVLDFGGEMRNYYSKNAQTSTSYNTANFHHLAIGLPIGRRFGVNLGITPYSKVGYEVERRDTSSAVVANVGDVRYKYRGEDGLTQIFFNLGFDVSPSLAVGAGVKYYFGGVSRYYNTVFSNGYYYSTYSSDILKVSNVVPVLGAQYTLQMDKSKDKRAVFGVSFQPPINANVTETRTSEVIGIYYDTAYHNKERTKLAMPMQLCIGASITAADK